MAEIAQWSENEANRFRYSNSLVDPRWYLPRNQHSIFFRPDGYWIANDRQSTMTRFEHCTMVSGPYDTLEAAKIAYVMLCGDDHG